MKTVVQTERAPAALITPCPATPYTIKTTGDLVRALNTVTADLTRCAAKVDGLAKWDAALANNAPKD